MHQAALGVLDSAALLDDDGHLRISEIRSHLESRLGRAPELRCTLHWAGPLAGRPVWIDDPNFRIEDHVLVATLSEPGGEAGLLAFAERRMAMLMNRSRPLWEIWLLEAYADDRVGLFIKVHHALADGLAVVNLVGQILDLEPSLHLQPTAPWTPTPSPARSELVWDNFSRKAAWFARVAVRLRNPVSLVRSAEVTYRGVAAAIRQGRRAPRTSINRPIGIGRRIGVTRLSLVEVKAVAHAQGVKVNDVFLYLIARGLREVLLTRGEAKGGIQLRVSIAVSLHRAGDTTTSGNLVGNIIVPLPLDGADPLEQLAVIGSAAASAKETQRAAGAPGVMVLLASTGLTRRYLRHQHMVNVVATNVPGPTVPLYFAGARLHDVVALAPLAGNVTASFAALSYHGDINLSVQVDEQAWPDLDVLLEGMRSGWLDLTRGTTV